MFDRINRIVERNVFILDVFFGKDVYYKYDIKLNVIEILVDIISYINIKWLCWIKINGKICVIL